MLPPFIKKKETNLYVFFSQNRLLDLLYFSNLKTDPRIYKSGKIIR